jgi:hypothetical protein
LKNSTDGLGCCKNGDRQGLQKPKGEGYIENASGAPAPDPIRGGVKRNEPKERFFQQPAKEVHHVDRS